MKKFLSSSALLAIQPFITKIIAYFVIPLYTLTLTPIEYGDVEFVLAIGVFFKTFISMSTTSSFWKYINDGERWDSRDVVFSITLIPISLGLLVILIGIISALLFPSLAFLNKNLLIYCLSETITVFYMIANLLIRNDFKAKRFLVITFLYVITFVCSSYYYLSFLGLKEKGVFFSYITSSLFVGVGSIYILKNYIRFKIVPELIKDIFVYSFPLMITNIVAILIAFADRLLIKIFRSSHELGLYSYGFKFGSIIKSVVIDVFFILWNPIRWKIYKLENGKEIFALFSKGLFILFLVFGFIFSIFGDLLGRLLSSNESYTEGLKVVPLVTFGYVFYGLYYYSVMGLLFKDKTVLLARIVVVVSIFNIVTNVLLLKYFGYYGSAVSMFVTYTLMFYYGFHESQKFYKIESFNIKNVICIYAYFIFNIITLNYYNVPTYVGNILFFVIIILINLDEIKHLYKNISIIKKSLNDVY